MIAVVLTTLIICVLFAAFYSAYLEYRRIGPNAPDYYQGYTPTQRRDTKKWQLVARRYTQTDGFGWNLRGFYSSSTLDKNGYAIMSKPPALDEEDATVFDSYREALSFYRQRYQFRNKVYVANENTSYQSVYY
jgi:hypothetical protein